MSVRKYFFFPLELKNEMVLFCTDITFCAQHLQLLLED